MQMVHQPILAQFDATPVCRALPSLTIRLNISAETTHHLLLAYAERATELLLYTPVDARLIPGRWRATLQASAHLVHYELVEGPLWGLSFSIHLYDLGGDRTQLQLEGTYMAPVKPLAARRRGQQLAESLQAGLARSLQHVLSAGANAALEQRATPRQALALPIRLRVGDSPWSGVTRDMSAGGLGVLVRTAPQEALAAVTQISEHNTGAVEVLLGDTRLTTRVQIRRARLSASGIDVGLQYGTADESARLRRRLAALDLWQGALDDPAR